MFFPCSSLHSLKAIVHCNVILLFLALLLLRISFSSVAFCESVVPLVSLGPLSSLFSSMPLVTWMFVRPHSLLLLLPGVQGPGCSYKTLKWVSHFLNLTCCWWIVDVITQPKVERFSRICIFNDSSWFSSASSTKAPMTTSIKNQAALALGLVALELHLENRTCWSCCRDHPCFLVPFFVFNFLFGFHLSMLTSLVQPNEWKWMRSLVPVSRRPLKE